MNASRCAENASVLTVTSLLALVPLMTLVVSVLSLLPGMDALGERVQDWIFSQFIPSKGQEIQAYIRNFSSKTSQLTAVGGVMLFITSILLLARIEKAFNQIWHVSIPRSGVISFLRYWAVLSLGPLFIGFGLVVTSYFTSLKVFTDTFSGSEPGFPLLAMPFMISVATFSFLYITVPNTNVPIKPTLISAFIAATVFEIAKTTFTWFLTKFSSYEIIYGAFAILPIFLIWLQLSWLILLGGLVLAKCLSQYSRNTMTVTEALAMLSILELLWRSQGKGIALKEVDILVKLPFIDIDQWNIIREKLIQFDVLSRSDEGEYLLKKRLENENQWAFMMRLGYLPSFAESSSSIGAVELSPALAQVKTMWQTSLQQGFDAWKSAPVSDWFEMEKTRSS